MEDKKMPTMGGKGNGGGRGNGLGRGQGQGNNGRRMGTGGANACRCPSCGHIEPHKRGVPCLQQKCPKCGVDMVGV